MHLLIHLHLLFTLFISSISTYPPPRPLPRLLPELTHLYPVCIVGAGISGLNLGILLKAKGYPVEIFEEKDQAGGKAETYREGNSTVQIDTGPLFFTNASTSLLSYITKFQLTPVEFNQRDQVGFDPDSGSIQVIPQPTGERAASIVAALQRYAQYHAGYRNDLEYGYLNTAPDLFLPFSTWLATRNLSILGPLFTIPVTLEGYGHLDDIPALYILKFIGPADLSVLVMGTETIYIVKEGMSALVDKMAQGLDVNLKHKVTSIVRRYHGLQELNFEDGQPVRKCQRVILAFPPLLAKVERVVSDLSSAEKQVLRHVKVHKYASAGHHIPPLDHMFYYEGITHRDPRQRPILTAPKGNCEVVAMLKQSTGALKNTYSSYSWIRGDYDTEATPDDLQKIGVELDQFLRKISPKPQTFFLKTSEYFPHVTTNSLQDGFYHKFDRLQGKDGLYYATTLLSFETLNDALEMTEAFVQKYF